MPYPEEKAQKAAKYWVVAKECVTNKQKIDFFDLYPEAFEIDPDAGEDLANAENLYIQEECNFSTEEEMDNWTDMERENYPDEYKVYLFENVILKGGAYLDWS